MIGTAACRGAVTIVNAIATGKGAAFGITLEADASVELAPGARELTYQGEREGRDIALGCVRALAAKAGADAPFGRVSVRSEIPISRGLKSSSAVSNAVVLAAARALAANIPDLDIVNLAIDESIKAGVTITGAFDDACACYLGGAVVTDNRARRILSQQRLDPELVVVLHVPERRITKASLKGRDFSGIRDTVAQALRLAEKGKLLEAMELNSKAYASALDLSEEAAVIARANGALAAGVTGTGPATAVVCRRGECANIKKALYGLEGTIMDARINDTNAREVVPRLL
jgi:shikimate kinase